MTDIGKNPGPKSRTDFGRDKDKEDRVEAALRSPVDGIFLSRQEWDGLAEKLHDPFFQRVHEDNLRALEAFEERNREEARLDTQRTPESPETRQLPRSVRPIRYRLVRNAVAWRLTQEPRFLENALETLESACTCPMWKPDSSPEHFPLEADLRTGELMYDLVFALDSLGPEMPQALQDLVRETLATKGLGAYLRGIEKRNWWMECDFNWNSALHGNAGLAALALRRTHSELARRVLPEVLRGLPFMIRAFPSGGGWIEGVMYADTAIGHLLDFAMPFYRLTGDDLGLLTNRDLHDTIAFQTFMRGGDGQALNFSDCNVGGREWGLAQHFWVADKIGRPDLAWPPVHRLRSSANTGGIFQSVDAFWFRQPFQETREPDVRGLHHFQGIDWLTWHGEHTWLAFRSGYNGGNHDNLDLGHFIFGRDGDRFLCDPGYGAIKTSQHNAVTMRHHEQCDGATARILSAETLETGRSFRLECDLQDAFPHTLAHHRRHLVLIDDLHLLVVDDVAGVPPIRNGARWFLQTRLPAQQDGEEWLFQGQQGHMRVMPLTEPTLFRVTEWDFQGPVTTISWRMRCDRVHSLHAMLLTCADARPQAEARVDGERLIVRVEGREWVFGGVA